MSSAEESLNTLMKELRFSPSTDRVCALNVPLEAVTGTYRPEEVVSGLLTEIWRRMKMSAGPRSHAIYAMQLTVLKSCLLGLLAVERCYAERPATTTIEPSVSGSGDAENNTGPDFTSRDADAEEHGAEAPDIVPIIR